ncbi:hypothetical protein TeGR_g565, partial [Tetraparma gracilis]
PPPPSHPPHPPQVLGGGDPHDDQDNYLTLEGEVPHDAGRPSGEVDFGAAKILCLQSPTPDEIIETNHLMDNDNFEGKITFSTKQWRQIDKTLKSAAAASSSADSLGTYEELSTPDYTHVVFVTTFPLLYSPSPSSIDDSSASLEQTSSIEQLSTIMSVGDASSTVEGASQAPPSQAGGEPSQEEEFSLASFLDASAEEEQNAGNDEEPKPATSFPSPPRPPLSPSQRRTENRRRRDEAISHDSSRPYSPTSPSHRSLSPSAHGDDESRSLESSDSQDQLYAAVPIPVPSDGFVLSDFRRDALAGGIDAAPAFGRDDPPWIGTSPPSRPGTAPSPPSTPPPAASPVVLDLGMSPSPEKDSVSVMVNGQEVGKVRESVVTSSMLQDLLDDEAEAKSATASAAASPRPSSPPSPPASPAEDLDAIIPVWPDKRPSVHFQLAKAQFLCGETSNSLTSLQAAIELKPAGITDNYQYSALLSNLTNTLQRGSEGLEFLIDCPSEEVVETFFPPDSPFTAFPLPSHVRARPKWKQLRTAILAFALETSLNNLLDDPDDVATQQLTASVAYSLSKTFGMHTLKLLRLSSVLLQKAFNEEFFEQPDTDKQKLLYKLARVHYDTHQAQSVAAEKEHLSLSSAAFDILFTLAPTPTHYLHYCETLIALGKKTQAVQQVSLRASANKLAAAAH